jgi:hypothetical protein
MQDEYIKAIEKIEMNKDRKIEMRKILENEMASQEAAVTTLPVRAKTSRLSTGAKAGIAAATVILSMSALMAIPSTRNAISASVRAFFHMEIPEEAEDARTRELTGREDRVIPTDDVDETVRAEIEAAVSSQDQAEDEYFETVNVNADYYSDPDLNEYANYYAQQNYYIMDIGKDAEYIDGYNDLRTNDWYSEGFFVSYTTGDNASPTFSRILVFKATPEQLEGFMKNNFAIVNYEREGHGQDKVSYEDFWTESTDSEGNAVYEASWTGPEPEMKLEPSDSARFMNFTITYDAAKQLVVCTINEGGGIG